MNDTPNTVDWQVIRILLKRHRSRLLAIGGGAAVLTFLALGLLIPREYTTITSLSIQQNNLAASGSLSGLAALGGALLTKPYDGVLKSRRFAEEAFKVSRIKEIQKFEEDEDAIAMIQNGIIIEDRRDGLVYLRITIPGPTNLAIDGGKKDQLAKEISQRIAESYINSLSHYMETTNSDHDAALLRQGTELLKEARDRYNDSLDQMANYIRDTSGSAGKTTIQRGNEAIARTSPEGIADALQKLYQSHGELQLQIDAIETRQKNISRISESAGQAIEELPAEEPTLMEARRLLREATAELERLRVTFADTNPEVVAARLRVGQARERLRREQLALRSPDTTDAIQLQSLQAQNATVLRQISEMEKVLNRSKDYNIELEKRRNEVTLQLEGLRAASTQYATLQVTTLASTNQLEVIDAPRLPKRGRPGLLISAAVSVISGGFFALIVLIFFYLRRDRKNTPA